MIADSYRNWSIKCSKCETISKIWEWSSKMPFPCPSCGEETFIYIEPKGDAPGVVGDSIPGGLEIKHGLCWPDGSPRRFDSKTDIKRAANEAGITIKGDTPKPYRVGWSGKAVDPSTNKRIDG